MLGKKIGFDLGTSTVRMVVKGEGPLVSEPSVLGMVDGDAGASLIGTAALEHGDSTALRTVRPMRIALVAV